MRLDDEPEVRASHPERDPRAHLPPASIELERYCPVCGAEVVQEKCKVVCRSESCRHRLIYTCSEF